MGVGAALVVVALLILIGFGYCATRLVPGGVLGRSTTTITHDVVVQQIRAVAKLVSSEATVRDVIVYENTWYGSTKRSLVVVTGRLLAGIDLRDSPDVSIDHLARHITIRIPPARLIAVEIRDMQTYDERGGLWNPFTREDRDAIQRQARADFDVVLNVRASLRVQVRDQRVADPPREAGRLTRVEMDRHDVEPARTFSKTLAHEVVERERRDSAPLQCGDRLYCGAERTAMARLHFHEHDRPAVARDDVQFSTALAVPPREDCVPAALQFPAREIFACFSKRHTMARHRRNG